MADVTPEAEALARVLTPGFHRDRLPASWRTLTQQAQRAIDAGWTPPPPDPTEVLVAVAYAWVDRITDPPDQWADDADRALIAAVRTHREQTS